MVVFATWLLVGDEDCGLDYPFITTLPIPITSSSATMTAHIPVLFLLICSVIAAPKQTFLRTRRIHEKINPRFDLSSNLQQASNLNAPADLPIAPPFDSGAFHSNPVSTVTVVPVVENALGPEVNVNAGDGSPLEAVNEDSNDELPIAQAGERKALVPQLPQGGLTVQVLPTLNPVNNGGTVNPPPIGITIPVLPTLNPVINGGTVNLPPIGLTVPALPTLDPVINGGAPLLPPISIPLDPVNPIETALPGVPCLFCPPASAWTPPTILTYRPLAPPEPSIPTLPFGQQGGGIPPDFRPPPGGEIPPRPPLIFITVTVPGKTIVRGTTTTTQSTTTTSTLARTTRVNTDTTTATRTVTDFVTALAVVTPTQGFDGSKHWHKEPDEGSYCQGEWCDCESEDNHSTHWNGHGPWKAKRCAPK